MSEKSTRPSVYYVVIVRTKYKNFQEAKTTAPDAIAEHLARSKKFHERGTLIMSGAFLDDDEEGLSTMAVHVSREAAEEYIKGDPFYLMGMIRDWRIREWANVFA